MDNIKASSERFFRLYHKHCTAPDLDTLFNLFNSIHNLNDIFIKTLDDDFFDIDEFIALKALRNLYHHQENLKNEVRVLPIKQIPSISSDLLYACLVPTETVEKSIDFIDRKYRENEGTIIRRVFKWYGEVVNINPCIFNFAVKAYEKIKTTNLVLSDNDFMEFEQSYKFETDNGYSHYVTGDINCHASDVSTLLQSAFKKIA